MEEASPEYMRDLYGVIAPTYAQRYFDDLSDSPIIDHLLAVLPKGGSVLDVGTGPGTFANYLNHQGMKTIGIDLSPTMLELALEKAPDGSFLEMDMRSLTFDSETFDGVLAAYSLIHIASDERPSVLSEFSRVLTPEGHALIIGQSGEPDHLEDDPLAPGKQIFVNFFDQERLCEEIVQSGFSIVASGVKPTQDAASMSSGTVWVLAQKLSLSNN